MKYNGYKLLEICNNTSYQIISYSVAQEMRYSGLEDIMILDTVPYPQGSLKNVVLDSRCYLGMPS